MYMYRDATKESSIDVNMKAYREMDFGTLWGGLSYRSSFDGAEYVDGTAIEDQRLQYITPVLGVNYKNFLFAYTYSYQIGNVRFDSGGFHQLTLGYDFGKRQEAYDCDCPAIN